MDQYRNSDLTVTELLHRLVQFDSSHHAGVRELLHFCADYLGNLGIDTRVLPSIDGESESLIATIGDHQQEGGVILLCHVDVPVHERDAWALDPFTLHEHEGRLSALGVANMKGALASLLAHATDIQQRKLPVPVHLILTHQHETVACSGTSLMRELTEGIGRPESIILTNPTSMRVALSHKGSTLVSTRVRGAPAHVSHNHKGVNALWLACHLVDYVEKIHGESKNFISSVEELDPPWTSINVGDFVSDNSADRVAGFASFQWEIRSIPELRAEELITQFRRYSEAMVRELQAVAPRVAVESQVRRTRPAFRVDEESLASKLVAEASGNPALPAISIVTAAPVLQKAGFSVAVFGPGDVALAGTPREFIDRKELERFGDFLFALMEQIEVRSRQNAENSVSDKANIA